jgi:hypothetical protein
MLPGARSEPAWERVALRVTSMERGQSTLEWVIGAAVILGSYAKQREYPLSWWVATQRDYFQRR